MGWANRPHSYHQPVKLYDNYESFFTNFTLSLFSGQVNPSGKGAKQFLLKQQPIKHETRPDHNTGNSAPYYFGEACGFFNVPCKP